MWGIQRIFHFSEEEMWNMTMENMLFWNRGANWVVKQENGKG